MQPKELSTVRVSNVSPGIHLRELEHFFESHGLRTIRNVSLCPSSCREDAPLVATVTFKSPSDARRALELNEKTLGRLRVSVERDFMGLTVLDAPIDSELDIVAVHGLNGHAFGTWACHDEDQANLETMWLRDFLPAQIRGARILVYGYNSTLLGPNTSVSTVMDFASDLLRRILADRDFKKHRTRPLIFVCHSLGGIVVKQALICAHASPERYNEIEAATRSILFLATPHGGSKSANVGSLLANVAALAFQRPPKQLLDTLKYESNVLSRLSEDFRAIHSPFDIINFYERRKTPILNSLVVDDISARLGVEEELLVPIDADHRRICKFNNPSDPRYLPVLAELRRCVEKATRKSGTTVHSIPANGLSATQHGHFLVPLPLNPQFVSRESELRLLDQYLCAKEGDTDLSHHPIVAIHGLGGVGKTQLANKYVHDRRKKDPTASIFWITARSEYEIKAGLQAIADKLSEGTGPKPLGNRLDLVTNWLCSPSHEDWLLVLDNYDDVRVDIRKFLPAGMLGAVLITSRDRKVIGSVATSGLALSAMDAIDAGRMFLDIQGTSTGVLRNKATAHPEAEILGDILKELQYFPLAIDQAASFIRENSPMTFREYLEYLKPRSINRERLMRFKQANPMYPESVMTTWEISLEYLERTQPRACKILQILGFLSHKHIAEDLLTTATKEISWIFESASLPKRLPNNFQTDIQYLQDDVGFRVAIGTLISLSMIRRDPAGPTLHVHPLVHEWIRVRLNVEPEQQARLTICATLVLYQSFPLELVAWLPDGSPRWSSDFVHRVDRVAYHITSMLQNLREYQAHAGTLPLECFVLCEIFILAEAPYHSIHPFNTSNEVSAIIDHVIRSMIPCLPQCQQPVAREIHKAISWLRSHSWSGGSFRTLHEIVDALEALLPTFPMQESSASFSLLVVTLPTDISRCVDYRPKRSKGKAKEPSPNTMSSWWTYLRDSDGAQDERHREINIRLFKALKRAVSNYPVSHFNQWISLMIDLRIINTLTPGEFASQTYLNVAQILSHSALRYVSFEQRGACLSRLARLLWESPEVKDYEGLRAVLSSTVIECKAGLKRERRAMKERQDSGLLRAWSHSSYISSSWGRSTKQGGKRVITTDLTGPIGYIWEIAIDAAKAISNPKVCWRMSPNDHGKKKFLNLEQRRWALELVLEFRKIRGTISKASSTSALMFLDHFQEFKCDLAFSAIYLHLEDWPMLRVCLSRTLQFEAIFDFCDSSHPRPWDYGQVSRRWKESQDPVLTRPVRQAGGGSSTNTDMVMLEAYSALLQLGIPESCHCICSVGVEEAIAAAIVLVDKEANLHSAEISNLQLHFSALPRMNHDPTIYLSRLEIIYKLACHLLVKPSSSIPQCTPVPINSSAGEDTPRSHLEASDDESSDDSTDSVDFGDQHNPTEYDWGW